MRYQWMLTLQWNDGCGQRMTSRSGTIDAYPEDTRSSLMGKARGYVAADTGAPSNAIILFFSLEPDELGG